MVDLKPGLDVLLISFFNYTWDSTDLWHLCLPGCCCCPEHPDDEDKADKVSYAKGLDILRSCMLIFPDVPLLYRWKHFEMNNAFNLRGKIFCNLHAQLLEQSLKNRAHARAGAAEGVNNDVEGDNPQREMAH